jgi:uncharacterized protein with HEPN domain
MFPSQLEFLSHISDECVFIMDVTREKPLNEIINDETLKRALVRSLEIIGEATKKINESIKNTHPQVDWKAMAGMRDKLIHDYFGIDYEIVFDAINNDIPVLYSEIQRIINIEYNIN